MALSRSTILAIIVFSLPIFLQAQDRESFLNELDTTFSGFLTNPAAYASRVDSECKNYPQGDLIPYTAIALAWCHQIYKTPASAPVRLAKIEKILDLALVSAARRFQPVDGDFSQLKSMDGYGAHLSQLGMALSGYRLAGGKRADLVAAEQRISQLLATHVMAANGGPIASSPSEVWLRDTSIALFALHLHDRVEGTQAAAPLIVAHRDWILANGIDAESKLPASQVGTPARGYDLSMRLALWKEMDAAQGKAWYSVYRSQFWKKATVAQGFREWSSDKYKTMDSRSGPILAGIGGMSTVLGLCASQAYEDSAISGLILSQASSLSKSRKSSNLISQVMAKTMDSALKKSGIPPVKGFVTGFLYGDAMSYYAASWHAYPAKPIQ